MNFRSVDVQRNCIIVIFVVIKYQYVDCSDIKGVVNL